MKTKTVLVISLSPLRRDGRVLRQIRAFSSRYSVVACGFGESGLLGVKDIPLKELPIKALGPRYLAQFVHWYALAEKLDPYWKEILSVSKNYSFDLVVANDLTALPVAAWVARYHNVPLVWDAHEWSAGQELTDWKWKYLRRGFVEYVLEKYLPIVSKAMTVSGGIAKLYQERFGVKMDVVYNAPPLHDFTPSLKPVGEPIRIVHHGGAVPRRKLEVMIRAFIRVQKPMLLYLYLVAHGKGQTEYLMMLKRMAAGDNRIHFLEPVPPEKIVPIIHQYDLGLYYLPPEPENHKYAMPNKLFEFIQARLGVVVTPNPDMASFVMQYGVGRVIDEFSQAALESALNELSQEQINQYKTASHSAARQFNYEAEQAKLLRIARESMGE